jgi:hypothetical protein
MSKPLKSLVFSGVKPLIENHLPANLLAHASAPVFAWGGVTPSPFCRPLVPRPITILAKERAKA